MSLEMAGSILGVALGVLALAKVFYLSSTRLAKMELKIDTVWEFQMRRAWSEAVKGKVAIVASPPQITEEAKAMMGELAGKLRGFYARLGRHMHDYELALEIERRFGDEMLRTVCIPHGMVEGVCLLIAVAIAKEGVPGAPPFVGPSIESDHRAAMLPPIGRQ